MAEEKTTPPAYPPVYQVQPCETKSSKKYLFGLIFYAGLVTAGLVTVSVLGSVYLNRLDTMCEKALEKQYEVDMPEQEEPKTPNKHYNVKEGENEQDIELDLDNDKEIIHYRDNGNKSIAVLDFKKNLVGIFDDQRDMCYLIAGIASELPDAREVDQILSNPQGDGDHKKKEYDYVVDKSRPVKDLTLVPDEIHSQCWGKPVYWAQRTDATDGDRQKRAICFWYLIECDCCWCYWWRICY